MNDLHIDIIECARCGENHYAIKVKAFQRPPKSATHWAICPNTHEPIMVHVLKSAEDNKSQHVLD